MEWFISPDWSKIAGTTAPISYTINGWHGPYASRAAAQTALNAHSGPGSPAPAGTWYVINLVHGGTGGPGIGGGILDYAVSQKPFPAGATEVSGPYKTKAEAEAGLIRDKKKAQSFRWPSVISDPLTAISHFLGKLGQPVFWLRAAEVVVGAVLLITGLGKMTGAGNIVSKAPKVIPI